jgi:hypothetical protein
MARYPLVVWKDPTTTLEAELFTHITREEFMLTEAKWRAFKDLNCPDPRNPPSNHHWDWNKKSSLHVGAVHKFLALKYAGEVEGMAELSLIPRFSKNPATLGQPVLYVEYLETAPWNQKAYAGRNRRFLGVGTCLITIATEESYRCGCEGRLALHSLDEARSFYMDQGFINLGFDPIETLDYFELHDVVLEK